MAEAQLEDLNIPAGQPLAVRGTPTDLSDLAERSGHGRAMVDPELG
jgi:hypothetical protein